MLVHACRVHAGDIITPSAQARLTASGRGVCGTENCDALRKHIETYCRKCKLYAPVRSFRDGERVPSCSARPGPSQTEDTQVPRNLFGDDEPLPVPDTSAELPEHFEERVDKLTSQTMLSPPEQFRYALTCWTADHFEAMNKGDATAGLLHRSMWKLLLAHIPRRCSTNHELTLRFRLWRSGQFTTLLERIEEQTQLPLLPSVPTPRSVQDVQDVCHNVVRIEKASNRSVDRSLI